MPSNNDQLLQKSTTSSKNKMLLPLIIVSLIILLLVIVLRVYGNSPGRRLQRQLDLGNRYLSELDYDQSLAAFEVALAIDEKSVDAYVGVIKSYIGKGDFQSALTVANTALELFPNHPEIISLRAQLDEAASENPSDSTSNDPESFNIEAFSERYRDFMLTPYGSRYERIYISRERLKEIYLPVIEEMEAYVSYLEQNPIPQLCDDRSVPEIYTASRVDGCAVYLPHLSTAYLLLADYYLQIDDLEKCMEIRTRLSEYVNDPTIISDDNYVSFSSFSYETTLYVYDKYGRISRSEYQNDAVGGAETDQKSSIYHYDDKNRLVTLEETYHNKNVGTGTMVYSYTYDDSGRIDNWSCSITPPGWYAHEEIVTFEYSGNSVKINSWVVGNEQNMYEQQEELDEYGKSSIVAHFSF